eukprot:COSAG03_NODE_1349_length_4278_cov_4.486001_4_plen_72_part_00
MRASKITMPQRTNGSFKTLVLTTRMRWMKSGGCTLVRYDACRDRQQKSARHPWLQLPKRTRIQWRASRTYA